MIENTTKTIDEYIENLEDGLRNSHRRQDICNEIRSDMEAHRDRLVSEGIAEEDAMNRVMSHFGNPYELAHNMVRELPPIGGKWTTVARYIFGVFFIFWVMTYLWYFRSLSYGVDVRAYAAVLVLHLPVILIVWPRIIWRRNWLFGLVPAVGMVVYGLFLNIGGFETETNLPAAIEEVSGGGEFIPDASQESSGMELWYIWVGGFTTCAFLWMAVQRKRQRVIILGAILGAIILVEIPFQIEEYIFRNDCRIISSAIENGIDNNPSIRFDPDSMKLRGLKLNNKKAAVRLSKDNNGFIVYWHRMLQGNAFIHYTSIDHQIRVHD